ncbi:MAG: tol-pal system protein YbgF [Bdellovibrionales bacterium]|nr:tol-pal system protein YbgF [Bdellovibrionales bacterium]
MRIRREIILCLGILTTGCLSSSKQNVIQTDLAKVSSDIQSIAKRLNKLEVRSKNIDDDFQRLEKTTSQARADQSVLIEDLKIENKTLQGSLEVLKHELQQAVSDNQKVKEDFDFRITAIEQKISDLGQASKSNQNDKKESPSTQYGHALNTFKSKNYTKAYSMFNTFMNDHPKSTLIPSAQYWAGECLYRQKKYSQAIKTYQEVVDKFPSHEKACAASYKQGLAFKAMKKPDNARLFFSEAIERCKNNNDVKKKAKRQLQKLGSSKK